MKIKLFGLLLVVAFQLSAQTNLKETVVVVRPIYSDETITFFKEISSALMNNGFISSAKIMRSNAYDVFGSGFIYKTDNGVAYIVTNKHVVNRAQKVNIEILKAIGDTIKYENCRVVAVSENADLALVALPKDAKITQSLCLAKTVPVEGIDVWSAGFPGLDGKPSWQLGKGIISNRGLQNKEVFDNEDLSLIQHTAQVDAGSSGGPLLCATGKNTYEVIGVNTWKLGGRENANVALPVEAVNEFIQTATHPKTATTADAFNKQVSEFAVAAKSDYKKTRKYISYQYVYQVTPKIFDAMLTNVSSEAKSAIFAQFKSGEPIEGIRSLIADALVQKVQKKAESLQFSQAVPSDTAANLAFDFNGKKYESRWENEQGQWNLSDLSLLSVKSIVAKNGIAYEYDYDRSWWLTAHFPVGKYNEQSYELGNGWILGNYGSLYGAFLLGERTRELEYSDDENYAAGDLRSDKFFTIEFGLGGQLPLRVASCYLIPYANLIGGLSIANDAHFFTGIKSGLKFGFKLSNGTVVYIGSEFKYQLPVSQWTFDKYKMDGVTSIGVSLGYMY